ncbi:MAG TPA: heavy metal-responsive transcriptional regulator [Pyrinomonadaceae bacterium]|jgi:DNA-binding transcriptional MerR regulator|nr:heavy metal-responsive transcriptional regulator [Pyrinomonadaceae bacterium]
MSLKISFRSGELARLAGISTDTLRHYERKGVLPRPRRSMNGYREYTNEALDRVRLVRRALSVGFTLDELAEILRERERGRPPCRRVREMAAAKLSDLETRLGEMMAARDELRATLKHWDGRLAKTAEGEPAALLDALAATGPTGEEKPKASAPSWRRRKIKEKDR